MPSDLGDQLTHRLSRLRRAVLARRRGLALLCAAAAVLAGLHAVRPPGAPEVRVLTAARDLSAGTVLQRADLTSRRFAPGTAPDGVLGAESLGRTLATGVRRGEPITDERLVGPSLSHDGALAVPVRLPDAGMAALLRVGDRIDVLATSPRSGEARAVAYDVPVLALPGPGPTGATGPAGADLGALVVLGLDPGQVAPVTGAAAGRFLTFAFSR